MKPIFATVVAIGFLASCQSENDPKVCSPIIDPKRATSIDEGAANNSDPVWVRTRAEACVHRSAYRLAASSDQAEIVARATIQACETAVDSSVSHTRKEAFDMFVGDPIGQRVAEADRVEGAARKSWTEFALLKVVEGRAGGCRP